MDLSTWAAARTEASMATLPSRAARTAGPYTVTTHFRRQPPRREGDSEVMRQWGKAPALPGQESTTTTATPRKGTERVLSACSTPIVKGDGMPDKENKSIDNDGGKQQQQQRYPQQQWRSNPSTAVTPVAAAAAAAVNRHCARSPLSLSHHHHQRQRHSGQGDAGESGRTKARYTCVFVPTPTEATNPVDCPHLLVAFRERQKQALLGYRAHLPVPLMGGPRHRRESASQQGTGTAVRYDSLEARDTAAAARRAERERLLLAAVLTGTSDLVPTHHTTSSFSPSLPTTAPWPRGGNETRPPSPALTSAAIPAAAAPATAPRAVASRAERSPAAPRQADDTPDSRNGSSAAADGGDEDGFVHARSQTSLTNHNPRALSRERRRACHGGGGGVRVSTPSSLSPDTPAPHTPVPPSWHGENSNRGSTHGHPPRICRRRPSAEWEAVPGTFVYSEKQRQLLQLLFGADNGDDDDEAAWEGGAGQGCSPSHVPQTTAGQQGRASGGDGPPHAAPAMAEGEEGEEAYRRITEKDSGAGSWSPSVPRPTANTGAAAAAAAEHDVGQPAHRHCNPYSDGYGMNDEVEHPNEHGFGVPASQQDTRRVTPDDNNNHNGTSPEGSATLFTALSPSASASPGRPSPSVSYPRTHPRQHPRWLQHQQQQHGGGDRHSVTVPFVETSVRPGNTNSGSLPPQLRDGDWDASPSCARPPSTSPPPHVPRRDVTTSATVAAAFLPPTPSFSPTMGPVSLEPSMGRGADRYLRATSTLCHRRSVPSTTPSRSPSIASEAFLPSPITPRDAAALVGRGAAQTRGMRGLSSEPGDHSAGSIPQRYCEGEGLPFQPPPPSWEAVSVRSPALAAVPPPSPLRSTPSSLLRRNESRVYCCSDRNCADGAAEGYVVGIDERGELIYACGRHHHHHHHAHRSGSSRFASLCWHTDDDALCPAEADSTTMYQPMHAPSLPMPVASRFSPRPASLPSGSDSSEAGQVRGTVAGGGGELWTQSLLEVERHPPTPPTPPFPLSSSSAISMGVAGEDERGEDSEWRREKQRARRATAPRSTCCYTSANAPFSVLLQHQRHGGGGGSQHRTSAIAMQGTPRLPTTDADEDDSCHDTSGTAVSRNNSAIAAAAEGGTTVVQEGNTGHPSPPCPSAKRGGKDQKDSRTGGGETSVHNTSTGGSSMESSPFFQLYSAPEWRHSAPAHASPHTTTTTAAAAAAVDSKDVVTSDSPSPSSSSSARQPVSEQHEDVSSQRPDQPPWSTCATPTTQQLPTDAEAGHNGVSLFFENPSRSSLSASSLGYYAAFLGRVTGAAPRNSRGQRTTRDATPRPSASSLSFRGSHSGRFGTARRSSWAPMKHSRHRRSTLHNSGRPSATAPSSGRLSLLSAPLGHRRSSGASWLGSGRHILPVALDGAFAAAVRPSMSLSMPSLNTASVNALSGSSEREEAGEDLEVVAAAAGATTPEAVRVWGSVELTHRRRFERHGTTTASRRRRRYFSTGEGESGNSEEDDDDDDDDGNGGGAEGGGRCCSVANRLSFMDWTQTPHHPTSRAFTASARRRDSLLACQRPSLPSARESQQGPSPQRRRLSFAPTPGTAHRPQRRAARGRGSGAAASLTAALAAVLLASPAAASDHANPFSSSPAPRGGCTVTITSNSNSSNYRSSRFTAFLNAGLTTAAYEANPDSSNSNSNVSGGALFSRRSSSFLPRSTFAQWQTPASPSAPTVTSTDAAVPPPDAKADAEQQQQGATPSPSSGPAPHTLLHHPHQQVLQCTQQKRRLWWGSHPRSHSTSPRSPTALSFLSASKLSPAHAPAAASVRVVATPVGADACPHALQASGGDSTVSGPPSLATAPVLSSPAAATTHTALRNAPGVGSGNASGHPVHAAPLTLGSSVSGSQSRSTSLRNASGSRPEPLSPLQSQLWRTPLMRAIFPRSVSLSASRRGHVALAATATATATATPHALRGPTLTGSLQESNAAAPSQERHEDGGLGDEAVAAARALSVTGADDGDGNAGGSPEASRQRSEPAPPLARRQHRPFSFSCPRGSLERAAAPLSLSPSHSIHSGGSCRRGCAENQNSAACSCESGAESVPSSHTSSSLVMGRPAVLLRSASSPSLVLATSLRPFGARATSSLRASPPAHAAAAGGMSASVDGSDPEEEEEGPAAETSAPGDVSSGKPSPSPNREEGLAAHRSGGTRHHRRRRCHTARQSGLDEHESGKTDEKAGDLAVCAPAAAVANATTTTQTNPFTPSSPSAARSSHLAPPAPSAAPSPVRDAAKKDKASRDRASGLGGVGPKGGVSDGLDAINLK